MPWCVFGHGWRTTCQCFNQGPALERAGTGDATANAGQRTNQGVFAFDLPSASLRKTLNIAIERGAAGASCTCTERIFCQTIKSAAKAVPVQSAAVQPVRPKPLRSSKRPCTPVHLCGNLCRWRCVMMVRRRVFLPAKHLWRQLHGIVHPLPAQCHGFRRAICTACLSACLSFCLLEILKCRHWN